MGLRMKDTDIYALQLADNQVLTAHDKEDIECMTWKIKKEYEKGGQVINLTKTKYLCIGELTGNLDLGNNLTVTTCDNYKYLGARTGKDGRDEKQIRERTEQERKAIKGLNVIRQHREIYKKNRYTIYIYI